MMTRIATILLGLTSLVLVLLGLDRIVYWASLPLGPTFGAGEAFGIFVGIVIVLFGGGVAAVAHAVWHDRPWGSIMTGQIALVILLLTYLAWSTPGPPPVPIVLTAVAAIVGVAMVALVIARALRRPAS